MSDKETVLAATSEISEEKIPKEDALNLSHQDVAPDEIFVDQSEVGFRVDPGEYLGLLSFVALRFMSYDKKPFTNRILSAQKYYFNIVRAEAQNIELDEIVQDGYFGLHQAAEKFDASLGYAFSTFAVPKIGSYIVYGSRNYLPWVVPSNKLSEVAQGNYDLPQLKREELIPDTYYDEVDNQDENGLWLYGKDLLPLDSSLDIQEDHLAESSFRRVEDHSFLINMFKRLDFSFREQEIVLRRFGLVGEPEIQDDVAVGWGVTRQRVQQVEAGLLKRIRGNIDQDFEIISESTESNGGIVDQDKFNAFLESLDQQNDGMDAPKNEDQVVITNQRKFEQFLKHSKQRKLDRNADLVSEPEMTAADYTKRFFENIDTLPKFSRISDKLGMSHVDWFNRVVSAYSDYSKSDIKSDSSRFRVNAGISSNIFGALNKFCDGVLVQRGRGGVPEIEPFELNQEDIDSIMKML